MSLPQGTVFNPPKDAPRSDLAEDLIILFVMLVMIGTVFLVGYGAGQASVTLQPSVTITQSSKISSETFTEIYSMGWEEGRALECAGECLDISHSCDGGACGFIINGEPFIGEEVHYCGGTR